MTRLNITPTQSSHTRDSRRDSNVTSCKPPAEDKRDHGSSMASRITGKSRKTKSHKTRTSCIDKYSVFLMTIFRKLCV
jgi:hypothetical protein